MTPLTLKGASLSLILLLLWSPALGEEKRSQSVRNAFVRENACPAIRDGRCLYDVDHKIALVCGGRDTVDNLAYLNRESHKLKSRDDVRRCRGTFRGWLGRTWRFVRYGE
jgi:hypothetical protein